jgi:hypothetical protein
MVPAFDSGERSCFDAKPIINPPATIRSPHRPVAREVLYERELFDHDRFLAQIDLGAQPYAVLAEMVELRGSEVAPALRFTRP